MTEYNPQKARTKRPCPLWVDAFQRDTQHLSADEVGAYMLLLMAMWSRETCDFPDDDRRLAAVCRVSLRLWKSRIGSVIRDFLKAENGALISRRLQKEAIYVEHQCKDKSNRRKGKTSDKPLKTRDLNQSTDISVDTTADQSTEHPTQQPNNPTVDGGGGDGGVREPDFDHVKKPDPSRPARPKSPDWNSLDREALLTAMRADPVSGLTAPDGRVIGGMADMQIAGAWVDDLGLTPHEITAVVAEVMAKKSDGPPSSFKYFTNAMQRYAGEKTRPALTPIQGDTHERNHNSRKGQPVSAASRAHESLAAAFVRAVSEDE